MCEGGATGVGEVEPGAPRIQKKDRTCWRPERKFISADNGKLFAEHWASGSVFSLPLGVAKRILP